MKKSKPKAPKPLKAMKSANKPKSAKMPKSMPMMAAKHGKMY